MDIIRGLETLRSEWSTIRRARWSLVVAAIVAAAAAALVVSAYYRGQLAGREEGIRAAQSELKRFEERFKSSSVRIRGAPRDALDVVENLRDMIQDARERQGPFSAFDKAAPFAPREFARYERRYRVRAQVLREFFLSKLPAAERHEGVQRAYDGPLSLEGLRLIADDLERLARKVPD